MPGKIEGQQNANMGWLAMVFLSLGALSATLVLTGRVLFSAAFSFPNTPSTTLLFLVAAAAARNGVPARFRWSVVAGLAFSAIGDAFLMGPKDQFLAGLASFLVAHVCYLWALTSDSPVAGHKLPFVFWGAAGVVLISWLWPGVPAALRVPVALYTLALLAMAAQAASRALSYRQIGAIAAAAGAALFVVSDSVLALQRFREPLQCGRVIVLGTYFAAQMGIALSVLLYRKTAGQP